MVAATTALAVFGGPEQVVDLVKKFDWSKMDVKDASRDDYLHLLLAPSFGVLDSTSIKRLDEQLKITIAGTMRAVAKVPPQQRSWDKVLEVMTQNLLLQPEESGISRVGQLMKEEANIFKVDSSLGSTIVREVSTWLINLIQDDDVLKSTEIVKVMDNIVAQTGTTINSFPAAIYKNEYHEKNIVDICVLRLPDIDHPHFKLYRIQLFAWSDSRRVNFVQRDMNGITGEFNSRIFYPRASVISEIPRTFKEQAIKEAEELFASWGDAMSLKRKIASEFAIKWSDPLSPLWEPVSDSDNPQWKTSGLSPTHPDLKQYKYVQSGNTCTLWVDVENTGFPTIYYFELERFENGEHAVVDIYAWNDGVKSDSWDATDATIRRIGRTQ